MSEFFGLESFPLELVDHYESSDVVDHYESSDVDHEIDERSSKNKISLF